MKRLYTKSESEIQRDICAFLTNLGIEHTVSDASLNHWRHRRSMKKAWPDITAILPPNGQVWAIEVKTARGEYRPGQKEQLERIHAKGGKITTARCLDDVLRDWQEYLRGIGK